MARIFHRENCIGCIRGQFVDSYGRRITIGGVHAFDYFIIIETTVFTEVRTTIYRFSNGRQARARFNELKKKR